MTIRMLYKEGQDISQIIIVDVVEYKANTLTDILEVTTPDGFRWYYLSRIPCFEVIDNA